MTTEREGRKVLIDHDRLRPWDIQPGDALMFEPGESLPGGLVLASADTGDGDPESGEAFVGFLTIGPLRGEVVLVDAAVPIIGPGKWHCYGALTTMCYPPRKAPDLSIFPRL